MSGTSWMTPPGMHTGGAVDQDWYCQVLSSHNGLGLCIYLFIFKTWNESICLCISVHLRVFVFV